eukprot:scaffold1223_cov136-Isochrysis_galbana.AAC.1
MPTSHMPTILSPELYYYSEIIKVETGASKGTIIEDLDLEPPPPPDALLRLQAFKRPDFRQLRLPLHPAPLIGCLLLTQKHGLPQSTAPAINKHIIRFVLPARKDPPRHEGFVAGTGIVVPTAHQVFSYDVAEA